MTTGEAMMQYEGTRRQVLEAAVEMAASGLVSGSWGVVSARGDADSFCVTPSGMRYHSLTPADIVVVDLQGNRIDGDRTPSTETPFLAYLYRHRSKVGGIVHTHSTAATAFATVGRPIPLVLTELAEAVGGEVPCARYARFGTEALARNVLDVAGNVWAALLANHGVVAFGRTVDEALASALVVEEAARVTLLAEQLGSPRLVDPDEARELRHIHLERYGQRPTGAEGS